MKACGDRCNKKSIDIYLLLNLRLRNIPLSPSDMTEVEAKEVREAILSVLIATSPRTRR